MQQQIVRGHKLEGFKGFVSILGAAALVYVFALIMQAAAKTTGMSGLQLISWVFAVVLVVFVMRNYIAEYRYTLSDGTLVLERTMGSNHGRVLYALPITDLLALGEEDAIRQRYGANAHLENLTLAKSPLNRRMLAFKKEGRTVLVCLQMDADFEAALQAAIPAQEN